MLNVPMKFFRLGLSKIQWTFYSEDWEDEEK